MYAEGAVTEQTCQMQLQSLVLEISHWVTLHGQVDQLNDSNQIETLRTSNILPCGRQPNTQNIQINKVTAENFLKRCLLFMEKNI